MTSVFFDAKCAEHRTLDNFFFHRLLSHRILCCARQRIPSSDGYSCNTSAELKVTCLIFFSGNRRSGSRHTLQVLCCLPSADKRLLCDCQLGRLAVLSQHLNEVRAVNLMEMLMPDQYFIPKAIP